MTTQPICAQPWRALFAGLGVAIALTLAACAPPPPSASSVESELLASPETGAMMRSWKQSDPATYERFLDSLVTGAAKHQSRDDLIAQTRAQLIAAARPRLARLDDAHTVELILVSRDEFRQLERSSPGACVAMFRGQPFGDLTHALNADVQQREIALMTAAFAADMNASHETLQGEALTKAATGVVQDTRGVVGDDVSMLSASADLSGKEARFCAVAAAFYDRMSALPQADAAKLMRSLMSSSS